MTIKLYLFNNYIESTLHNLAKFSDNKKLRQYLTIIHRSGGKYPPLLSIYAAKLKTALLKTRALRAANDS